MKREVEVIVTLGFILAVAAAIIGLVLMQRGDTSPRILWGTVFFGILAGALKIVLEKVRKGQVDGK